MHMDDRPYVESTLIKAGALVTIRKGELAFYPMAEHPQPVENEFLKILGSNADWSCRFYDSDLSSCSIHDQRPSACRALKCWDTEDVLDLAGKKLLTRFDFLRNNDSLLQVVCNHEDEITCPDFTALSQQLNESTDQKGTLQQLADLVNRDLYLRSQATKTHNLSLSQELFYLGRPFFQVISPLGITVLESAKGMKLQLSRA